MKDKELKLACLNNEYQLVESLIREEGVDPSEDNNEAIIWASESGHHKTVQVLMGDERVNPAAKNNLALRLACSFGHTDVVKVLLRDARVDPTCLDNKTIKDALTYGHHDIAILLMLDGRVKDSEVDLPQIIIKNDNEVDYAKHLKEHLAIGEELFNIEVEKPREPIMMTGAEALDESIRESA